MSKYHAHKIEYISILRPLLGDITSQLHSKIMANDNSNNDILVATLKLSDDQDVYDNGIILYSRREAVGINKLGTSIANDVRNHIFDVTSRQSVVSFRTARTRTEALEQNITINADMTVKNENQLDWKIVKDSLRRKYIELNKEFPTLNRSENQIEMLADEGLRQLMTVPEQVSHLYADRPKKSEDIVQFISRVWFEPWIKDKILTRPDFRRLDPQGEMALRNWLRDKKHVLPERLRILTHSEAVKEQVSHLDESDEKIKFANRIRNAKYRERKKSDTIAER